MSARRIVAVLFSIAGVMTAFMFAGCSSKGGTTYPTAPPGGGGGGGGGGGAATTFNFTFVSSGETHRFTFPTAGAVAYHCLPHESSGMVGSVNVSASATADSDSVAVGWTSAGVPGLGFFPSSVSIKPGGHVTWYRPANVAMTNHTVTAP